MNGFSSHIEPPSYIVHISMNTPSVRSLTSLLDKKIKPLMYLWILPSGLIQLLYKSKCHRLYFPNKIVFLSLNF